MFNIPTEEIAREVSGLEIRVERLERLEFCIDCNGGGGDHGLLAGLGDDDHTQYVLHSLADAANDFLVASGADTFVKKTLAQTGAILEGDIDHGNIQGLADDDHIQYILHSLADVANDFLIASGPNTYVKKTLAETGAILETDLDHGNIQGLGDDDHAHYLLADGTRNLTGNLGVDAAVTIDGVDISALKTDVDNFPDELQGLTAAEVTQLQAIDGTTISGAQWGILGIMDQAVSQVSSPSFVRLTLGGPTGGLHLLDTNQSHDLIIRAGSNLTADRILTLTTGDAARTLTLSGNPTLDDWFDQAVKAASGPTFDNIDITNNIVVGGTVDGIDIATDVATNTTHSGGDGTDHSALIPKTLADAANDFLVASGNDTFVKKTLAETGAILETDLDHGNLQGLDTGADHSFINQDVKTSGNPTFAGLQVTGFMGPSLGSELTMDGAGDITVTGSYHTVDTFGDAASDDLNTVNGGVSGDILVLRANNSTRTVVCKDGGGNLLLGGDFPLDHLQDTIMLLKVGGSWVELSRSSNA